ncbi:MAG: helix-turn-helix domain-containing protein [Lachnospiraceae bacterium]|nr:helix-turn-helix domain-containing protein [Lachnospiraceae bacterium]
MLQEYPDILTPQEAMEILGIGKNLFYKLLKDGEIPAKRIRNKIWRIAKENLIHYIQTN